jgi:ABC-type multidrug transport system fused ATPase/permease subunit
MPDTDTTRVSRERLVDLRKLRLSRDSMEGAKFLLRYLRPYRWKFIAALLALLVSSLAGLAFPALTRPLVDAALEASRGSFSNLNRLTFLLFGALFAQSLFSYIRTYFLSQVSERSLADLRYDLFSKLLRLPMSFHHRTRVGELTSRITSDLGQIQAAMTTTVSELIRQTVLLVGSIGFMAYYSPRLMVVIMTSVPVIVVLAFIFGKMIRKQSKRMQDLYAKLNTIAEETFQGIGVVKAYTAEGRESARYKGMLGEIIGIALRVARARGAFIAFIIFALSGGIVAVIWYGAHLMAEGSMTIGTLTSFLLFAFFVGGALGSFGDLYGSFQGALGASERVREMLQEVSEPLDTTSDHPRLAGHVELRSIGFAYPSRPDVPVLKDITLDVPAGSSVALVGPSGAGKSTIAGILMRFYEPTSGSLVVDGRDASNCPLLDFRSAIAIVPQDVTLFGGTIAENIAYGNPEAPPEQIREAARLANAADFIDSFPEGYETIVGERGVQLSGGQRQRIAIARAIIKDPSILILDEATSSLDSESESLVQEALDRVMAGRTTFIIAHRLSTIRNADMVAVISQGGITESGGYEELVAAGGVFARLVALQNRVGEDVIDEAMMGKS